jgi:Tfp pilus assembly PilM family ATPase
MKFLQNKFCSKIRCAFPTPKYLTFNTFGIDIAPDAVRILKLKATSKGLIPVMFKEFKYKKVFNLYDESFDISNNKEVLDILKKIKQTTKIKHAVVSLPEINTYIYRTKIPLAASSDIASAILFQIEDNVPLKLNEVNFDYNIIPSNNKKDLDIVVNVFPKKIIRAYTDLLKKVNIFPLSFQADSVAVSKAVIKKGDNNAYMIIRIVPNRTTISIVEDETVQFTTDLQIGSDDFQKGFNTEQAEILKESLNKILIYWFTSKNAEIEHKKIQTAFVVGDMADNHELIDYLEKHLKINVDTGNVWINCFCLNNYVPKLEHKDALNYVVAIGLAIKTIEHA